MQLTHGIRDRNYVTSQLPGQLAILQEAMPLAEANSAT
jgi:hypothetical protein